MPYLFTYLQSNHIINVGQIMVFWRDPLIDEEMILWECLSRYGRHLHRTLQWGTCSPLRSLQWIEWWRCSPLNIIFHTSSVSWLAGVLSNKPIMYMCNWWNLIKKISVYTWSTICFQTQATFWWPIASLKNSEDCHKKTKLSIGRWMLWLPMVLWKESKDCKSRVRHPTPLHTPLQIEANSANNEISPITILHYGW